MSDYLIDYWNAIEERLHEESMLHYPRNQIRSILEQYINRSLEDLDTQQRTDLLNDFLITCTGKYLDERGYEMGLTRNKGEGDASYRQRIFNTLSEFLSRRFIQKQGIILYTKKTVNDKIRQKLTSNNPYLNNKYAIIPNTDAIRTNIGSDIINDDLFQLYKKGW